MDVDGITKQDDIADDFESAWTEATEESEKDEKKPEGEGLIPKEDDEAAGKSDEGVLAETDKDKEEKPPIPEETEAEKKYKELEHKHKTLQGEFGKLKDDLKALKTKEPEPERKPVEEKEDDVDFKDFYEKLYDDLDEVTKKTLKEYSEEFDTPSKIEDVKRQHSLKKVIDLIEKRNKARLEKSLTEFAEAVKKTIQPLFETVEVTQQTAHYRAIQAAHPQFETYRDDGSLKAWIDAQPRVLKKSLQDAYENGTTEDVIDMCALFEKDTGLGKKKADDAVDTSKEEEARQAKLNQQTTIKSKSIGVNIGGADKAHDFDSAFDEAMKKTSRR